MVELQIVVLAVAGSSPVGHPTFTLGKLHLQLSGGNFRALSPE